MLCGRHNQDNTFCQVTISFELINTSTKTVSGIDFTSSSEGTFKN